MAEQMEKLTDLPNSRYLPPGIYIHAPPPDKAWLEGITEEFQHQTVSLQPGIPR